MKLHEPKQLNNQTPWGSVQTPGRGQFMLQVKQLTRSFEWNSLKKTNPGESQAFLRSHLKMYMTVFFHFYSESNPKQIAKSVVFVMNTLSETKVIDLHPLSTRTL